MTVPIKQSDRDSDRNNIRPMPLPRGGGSSVAKFTVHQLVPWGFPTAGEVSLTWTIPDSEDEFNDKTTEILFPWDCTRDRAKTELLKHTSLHDEDHFNVLDGPWPFNNLWIEFTGPLKGKFINGPVIVVSGLTGGSFPQVLFLRRWLGV